MHTTNCKKFKGEIENYVRKGSNIFESKIERAFSALRLKTLLTRNKIKKKDGYHAAHLLFTLTLLPILKVPTVHSFCLRHLEQWSKSRKDTFYRFKNSPYRWRSFMSNVINCISTLLRFEAIPREERYFIVDDSILTKRGRKIENVSYVFDHNIGHSVLGFCTVTLGLFTGQGFYPLDFAYRFGKTRHPKSPEEKIGDPRSISGQRSYEAKHCTKLELAQRMIQGALHRGINAGYVLFDSWYAWPVLINAIRNMCKHLHVICRLKDSKVRYEYKGKKYQLSELYQKIKSDFKKDIRTGLLLKRVMVKLPDSNEDAVIVFSKGYREPEEDLVKGKKKEKEPKWVAFLSTDTRLHASTIIKKYTKRWTIEVFFKECKQLLDFGKDQSNNFNAQVFATSLSFLRYNLLNFLNEKDNFDTTGALLQYMSDESAIITYAQRLWDFFRGLFCVSFATIFKLFKIEEKCSTYIDALTDILCASTPIRGCET